MVVACSYLRKNNMQKRFLSVMACPHVNHALHRLTLNQSLSPTPATHMRIRLFIVVLQVPYNISHSHGHTSHMSYNKTFYLCIIRWMITCMLRGASCDTLKVLVSMVYTFIHHPLHLWSVHRHRLERFSRYQEIHLLRIFPWLFTIMVFQTSTYIILRLCWSRIPQYCQCSVWILLVTESAPRVTLPDSQSYHGILW